MAAHAKLSPSSAHRWMRCPNSAVMAELYPSTTSVYAEEGTRAHEQAEAALRAGTVPEDEDVAKYVEYVRSIPGSPLVEQKLSIASITLEEGATGTADAVVVGDRTLWVVDLKFGRGERVDAPRNPQLMAYGLAALREYAFVDEFDKVVLVIVQPRLNHLSEWETTPQELEAFGKEAMEAARLCGEAQVFHAEAGGFRPDLFEPGPKQCRWCTGKAHCPALEATVRRAVAAEFEDLDKPVAVFPISSDRIAELLGMVDLVEDWCRAIRARAESDLLSGVELKGWKLVEGRRGARKWADAAKAVDVLYPLLGMDTYTRELVSPAQAEKLVPDKALLAGLVVQAEGKPTVVPETDNRPALKRDECEFENLDEEKQP